MSLLTRHCNALTAIGALCYGLNVIFASTIAQSATSSASLVPTTVTSTPIETCKSPTINYITHNLPQVCFRSAWSDPANSGSAHATETDEGTPFSTEIAKSPAESGTLLDDSGIARPDADSALDDSTFLSFEDWKRQTLEKEGLLDPIGSERRAQLPKDGGRRRNSDGIQDALRALEEDVIIDADFTAFLGERAGDPTLKTPQGEERNMEQTLQDESDDRTGDENRRVRSEDAGKTCKERFNFASLDVGAQIMKANPEAKSASALLKEDRDVYMLNTCQAKNKFLVVELSESILVDTLAIANFEFFSSTFREFCVSVSDRYPAKLDRWVDLGTFEARNSRDIQAFLINDPRIWARYLKIEFLSHYGNEFYCPVSLLRVHGRTMIQDVLSMEELTRREDENENGPEDRSERDNERVISITNAEVLGEEIRVTEGLKEAQAALEELVKAAEAITSSQGKDPFNSSQIMEARQWLENISLEQTTTPWTKEESALTQLVKSLHSTDICLPADAPASPITDDLRHLNEDSFVNRSDQQREPGIYIGGTAALSDAVRLTGVGVKEATVTNKPVKIPDSYISVESVTSTIHFHEATVSQTTSVQGNAGDGAIAISSKLSNKTSPISSVHGPQPTTQESFFKTVTKRLQLLEANSTLSLKYIEEQSKNLRDAFTKVERRQLVKTTSFLENLNATVLEELRKFSQQYDQIWQSTVIELETQRDQSQREIAAVSTRLSMLAEELVFQKRMSIVQSVLLLICLGLVIFSRSSSTGYLDVPTIQSMIARSRNVSDLLANSASSSPPPNRVGPSLRGRSWLGPEHRRQRSDDTAGSLRSASRDYSPPTPFSTYSGQEEDSGHDDLQDDLLEGARTSLMGAPTKHDELPNVGGINTTKWKEPEIIPEESYPDFRNSALWLAPNSSMRDSNHLQTSEETTSRGDEQAPIYDIYKSEVDKDTNGILDERRFQSSMEMPYLPSSASESQRPEFSIARKPLPALPRDDQ